MAFSDWNQMFENIPDEWRATRGQGVKIALLDSGAELSHPAFAHIQAAGHAFWVARPDFDPTAPLPPGNDEVSDAKPMGVAHGTACLGVLGALPEAIGGGVKGVAPEAEYFIIKISATDAAARNGDLVNAIELAVKLGVDIIACSVLPRMTQTVTDGRLQAVFGLLEEKRTLLFSSLKNTDDFERLNNLRFPSDQAASIVSGVATPGLLTAMPAGAVFDSHIAFLHPAVPVRECTAAAYLTDACSSSLATAALAGLAALRIAHWKAQEGPQYQRRTREAVLAELRTAATPFSKSAMQAATAPAFFHLLK